MFQEEFFLKLLAKFYNPRERAYMTWKDHSVGLSFNGEKDSNQIWQIKMERGST